MSRRSRLPNGWREVKLGRVALLSGRIGWKGLTAKEYTDNGPFFLSVHSLNYGDYVDYRDAFHITQKRYDESPEIMLRPNDVLICKDGAGIGKLGIVGEGMPGQTTINSSLLLVRAQEGILPKYLYYSLSSPYFQEIVKSRLMGATTPHLYQRDIAEFPIYLPPLSIQQPIVAILDEAFAGLATATANVSRNLKNASRLFEAYLKSVFARRNGEWAEKFLRDVSIEFGRGKSKHRPRNDPALYGGKYPFIQTGDIRNAGGTIVQYSQSYNEKGLAQSKLWPRGRSASLSRQILPRPVFLVSMRVSPTASLGWWLIPFRPTTRSLNICCAFSKRTSRPKGKAVLKTISIWQRSKIENFRFLR